MIKVKLYEVTDAGIKIVECETFEQYDQLLTSGAPVFETEKKALREAVNQILVRLSVLEKKVG